MSAKHLLFFLILLLCALSLPALEQEMLVDFSAEPLPSFVAFNGAEVVGSSDQGLEVRFKKAEWPRIYCQAPSEGWDWSHRTGIGFSIHNSGVKSVTVAVRVDNAGADGSRHCLTLKDEVIPGKSVDFKMSFRQTDKKVFWGMRGTPPAEALSGNGDALDLSAITAFQLFLPQPEEEATLVIKEAYLFGSGDGNESPVELPFVDAFGQYKHAQWLGKLQSEEELSQRLEAEIKELAEDTYFQDRDSFGGWLQGPQLEATGWFRTEEINGKWWLVTPSGHLFLTLGVNCVRPGEHTFIEKRESWFEALPALDDPLFSQTFSSESHVHSMAETIDGGGKTFNPYHANLLRKYGETWQEPWRSMNYNRLKAWGFNTIGNWSPHQVLMDSTVPFTTSTTTARAPRMEAAQGYWGKIFDVYDPAFEETVEPAIVAMTKHYKDNPLCIGYFVDNELAWEGAQSGVLASDATQSARRKFLEQLQETYGSLEALNDAWKSDFSSWDELQRPKRRTEKFKADMERFLYEFALQYFTTVNTLLKRHAPNQLYLGCRFSPAPEAAVRACAEVADVVSVNIYRRHINPDKWAGDQKLSKPFMIGEFHFGALDRGMFHTGLVSTENQQDRAEHYKAYVQSVLEHPAFVGCHWFQWVDEPLTGRSLDGENYNIGFLDVTDTPYPEIVEAARDIHGKAYEMRYNSKE